MGPTDGQSAHPTFGPVKFGVGLSPFYPFPTSHFSKKSFPTYTPSESTKKQLLAGLAPVVSPTPSRITTQLPTTNSPTKQTNISRGPTNLLPFGTSTKPAHTKTSPAKPAPTPILTPPDSPAKVRTVVKPPTRITWSTEETDKYGPLTVLVDSPILEAHTAQKRWSWAMCYELSRHLHSGLPDSLSSFQPLSKLVLSKNEITPQSIYLNLKNHPNLPSSVNPPHSNVDTEIERQGFESANMRGVLHFYGSLKLEERGKKLVVELRPVEVGPGNRFFRQYGSDRFFRLKIPQELSLSFENSSSSSSEPSEFSTFLSSPLLLFGRIYRPFCYKKEGSLYYFCESGNGIKKISLERFCENHIEGKLNEAMSVSKYRSRFELGLTPTTPTILVPHFVRIPDLMNDSLKISYGAMKYVYQDLILGGAAFQGAPEEYVPSCIEGNYTLTLSTGTKTFPMVWYLNFATVNNPSDPRVFQCRPGENGERSQQGVSFCFWIKKMNGDLHKTSKRISDPSQIEWVDDKMPEKREIMTDGCSLVTQKAMQGIYEKLLDAGVADQESRPCAAQARCGPAKGVWSEAPPSPWSHHAILESRDSQTKYNDTTDRTKKPYFFEVHSIPHSKSSAKLNVQYLAVLAHDGVSNEAFIELLRNNYKAQKSLFFDNFDNLAELLHIIETRTPLCALRELRAQAKHHPTLMKIDDEKVENEMTEDDDGVAMYIEERFADLGRDPSSATPNTIWEVAADCLRHGLSPRHSYTLANCIRKIAKLAIESTLLKSNIELDNAKNVLVIADHLGVLGEGEVFYQSKRPIYTSLDGSETTILSGPALVGRAPARLPSDFQKVVGVYREQYSSFKEVLILSSKGAQSLCSLLSGGDYDGDRLIVIAEKTLVNAFNPEKADPSYAIPPFNDVEYFDVDTQTVLKSIVPLLTKRKTSELSSELIKNLSTVRRYARLSEYFQRLEYCFGLDDEDSILVAHLFGKDLDGAKQGLTFNEEAWQSLSKRLKKKVPLQPKHVMITKSAKLDNYNPSDNVLVQRPDGVAKHLMDALQDESRALLEEFKQFASTFLDQFKTEVDPDFARPFEREYQLAIENNEVRELSDIVMMSKHVKANYVRYGKLRALWAKHKEANGQSPQKSPEKKRWRSSSPGMKQDLLRISHHFWSLLSLPGAFESSAFRGEYGAPRARSCMASIAYLMPFFTNAFDGLIKAFDSPHLDMPKFSPKKMYPYSFGKTKDGPKTQCGYTYEVALRDLLALKATAMTNRDYERAGKGASLGLGAPVSYQPILDTMAVKRSRLSGVVDATNARPSKKAKMT